MRRAPDQGGRLSRWTITTGAWFLAGFLLITIALILSVRDEDQSFPSITNVRASGYAAFAELLRRDGYEVVIDRSVRPQVKPEDLAFATSFDVYIPNEWEEMSEDYVPEPAPYQDVIKAHLEAGGKAIEVFNRENFALASSLVEQPRYVEWSGDLDTQYLINAPYGSSAYTALDIYTESYDAWYMDEEPFVSYIAHKGGLLVTVADGLPITNRFLDEHHNAAFFLDIVRGIAAPGSRIVFIEAGIGNAETPSVVNTLGQWAVVARWQIVLLFVVVVLTLGIRFGLPTAERKRVRGSRELFDAVGDVLRRTRNTGLALDNLLLEVDQRIRTVTKSAPTTARHEFLRLAPSDLQAQYMKVAEMCGISPHPGDASREAAKLLALLQDFERDSRAARGLKR